MMRKLTLLVLIAAAAAIPVHAQNAAIFFSNGIEGDGSRAGREGSSDLLGYFHAVEIPELTDGSSTGTVEHAPVHFTKYIDRASPLLIEALDQGTRLDSVGFAFYRVTTTGTEERYFTITITGVRIVRSAPFLANPADLAQSQSGDVPLLGSVPLETLQAVYETITWRHIDGYEYMAVWEDGALAKLNREQADLTGERKIVTEVYPNPFNASATLTIRLPEQMSDRTLEVDILDTLGREVKRIALSAANDVERVSWDGTDAAGVPLPSGLYLYRVSSGTSTASGAMMLMK